MAVMNESKRGVGACWAMHGVATGRAGPKLWLVASARRAGRARISVCGCRSGAWVASKASGRQYGVLSGSYGGMEVGRAWQQER